MTREDKILYKMGWVLIGITLMMVLLIKFTPIPFSRFLVPCVFHYFTGYYCPGCGGTRAVIALFKGDFLQSIRYHPLVMYGVIMIVFYMLSNTIEILSCQRFKVGLRFSDKWVYLALVIIVINFLLKNALLVFGGIDLLKK